MSLNDDLLTVLKKLRLSGVLQTLDLRSRQASEDALSHAEFLYRLLGDEVERRDGKQLMLRLRRAAFDKPRSLEDFDFTFNPSVPKSQIIDLATCQFLERKENVLLIGPTGVGKSHVAQALGQRACRAGYGALYVTADQLLAQLRAARADASYDRALGRLVSPELLIVDDLGLRGLRHEEPLDLYEVIRQRYEVGSLIMTSNRAVHEWYPLFSDDLLASAAMDRLLHHAHVVTMDGDSFRNPPHDRKVVNRPPGNSRPERTVQP
ncbi:MAG: IS21-like element helper ATPase IstB [Myxococcota bacterium]|nr:IS21-like element helper ATPase IstB [Myxococcota bacterium]